MSTTYVKYIGTQIGHQETLPAGSAGIAGIVTVNPGDVIQVDSKAAALLIANESSSWAAASDPTQASKHVAVTSTGPAPAVAAGANAGTSPPAPVIVGDDSKGEITFGTGTSAAAGAQVAVTFNTPYTPGTTPRPVISPANAATAALLPYISAQSATGFTVSVQGSPSSSQASTVYAFNYIVIG
jgi:hypothetical protein